jgi:hypothetical protein
MIGECKQEQPPSEHDTLLIWQEIKLNSNDLDE